MVRSPCCPGSGHSTVKGSICLYAQPELHRAELAPHPSQNDTESPVLCTTSYGHVHKLLVFSQTLSQAFVPGPGRSFMFVGAIGEDLYLDLSLLHEFLVCYSDKASQPKQLREQKGLLCLRVIMGQSPPWQGSVAAGHTGITCHSCPGSRKRSQKIRPRHKTSKRT